MRLVVPSDAYTSKLAFSICAHRPGDHEADVMVTFFEVASFAAMLATTPRPVLEAPYSISASTKARCDSSRPRMTSSIAEPNASGPWLYAAATAPYASCSRMTISDGVTMASTLASGMAAFSV